ncbi:MAG: methyl-accepting chemotaxis protein, partial [Alishewanella sp.]|nr:methyl-accepting chemotaxis protein [Alishewanella sp.]
TKEESTSLNQQAKDAQNQINETNQEFALLQQELLTAQGGMKTITSSVSNLEEKYQQTHEHLSAIQQITNQAYQQMASIDDAAKNLLEGTATTEQQLGRFARKASY